MYWPTQNNSLWPYIYLFKLISIIITSWNVHIFFDRDNNEKLITWTRHLNEIFILFIVGTYIQSSYLLFYYLFKKSQMSFCIVSTEFKSIKIRRKPKLIISNNWFEYKFIFSQWFINPINFKVSGIIKRLSFFLLKPTSLWS